MGKIAGLVNPYVERGRGEFERLAPKDQKAVLGLTAFLVAVGFWFLIWKPSQEWMTASRAGFEREQQTEQFLEDNYQRVLALTKGATGSPKRDPASVVSTTGRTMGLQLTRVQPVNEGVSVWIDTAPYQKLLAWLIELSNKEKLNVKQIRLERTSQEGIVKVFMRLAR